MTRLEKFLTNRGLLKEFETNYRSTSTNRYTYENYINHFGSGDIAIHSAFGWSDTQEGYAFWRKLNVDWVESLRSNTL